MIASAHIFRVQKYHITSQTLKMFDDVIERKIASDAEDGNIHHAPFIASIF
jgi:hypothetical protein